MALVLIKEDGLGRSDANAYASVADADAYHEGHLYAAAWTAASADNKVKALVFAARLIDGQFKFNGTRVRSEQSLQWPRQDCHDPDADGWAGGTVGENVVPKAVMQATCEMARELLIADRTAAPAGEGLKYQNVGSNQTGYDKDDRRPIISHVAQALLAKYGSLLNARSGSVQLIRV